MRDEHGRGAAPKDEAAPARRFRLEWEKLSGAPGLEPVGYRTQDESGGHGPDKAHLRRIVWERPPRGVAAGLAASLPNRVRAKR